KAGRKPVLIWPGLSSLYFVYATVDVLGYSDATSRQPLERPGTAVAALIADHPDHPYARAGLDALRDGVALLMEWLEEAGFRWQGSLDHNLLLPTAIGTPKPSCLYAQSMAAGDLGRDEPIVLCGFEGYEVFAPELAASNLSRSWGRGDRSDRAIRVSLPGFEPAKKLTFIDLARRLEYEATRGCVNDPSRAAPTSWRSRTWSTARSERVSMPWSTPSFTNRSHITRCQPSAPTNRCSSHSHSRPLGTASPIGCSHPPATAIRWRAMY